MPALQLDSLDKSTWQTFRFEQIARSIGERVEPSQTDLETYVGLEHIDPESIHIKRFGTRDDVSGTKLRCYPGDVIFGRRRAYQRKAAICEFDGFCSAHSLVLRANPKVIDPKLFPFFLHSDTFMHRAVDISVGSLSPTINWKTLKTQQFLLPPKDQQAKLAELLRAADAAVEAQLGLAASLSALKASALSESFDRGQCQRVRLSEISTNLDRARKPVKKSNRAAGSIPYYGASGIVDYVEGFTHNEPILLVSEDGENLSSRKLPIAYEVDGKAWVNNHAHAIRVHDGLRHLVAEYLNAADLSDFVSGTTRPKLTKSTLDDLPIYLPPKERRETTDSRLRSIDGAAEATDVEMTCSRNLLKSLINEIF